MLCLTFFSSPVFAKGPTSFGPLSIGMSQSQVVNLPADSSFRLVGDLVLDTGYRSTPPDEGQQTFDSMIKTPFDEKPLKIALTFKNEELISIFLSLGESEKLFNELRSQITEKYGQVRPVNRRKTEQCIYRNGANFQIQRGYIKYTWTQKKGSKVLVQTELSDYIADSCSDNLASRIGAVNLKSLTISSQPVVETKKKQNAF